MAFRGLLVALAVLTAACGGTDESDGAATASGKQLAEPALDTVDRTPAPVSSDPAAPGEVNDDRPGAIAYDAAESGEAEDTSMHEPETSGTVDEQTSAPTTSVPASPLASLTSELISFVEAERGLEFSTRPGVELLDAEEFGAAWSAVIAEDVRENGADYVNYTDIYRALGIITDGRSLEEIWTRFGDAGVIGFYDPASGSIKLRSGEITTFTETVLVHELVHALEDQTFGLERPEYDLRTDEIDWTFSALTEGSARVIEARYRATLTDAERAEEDGARRALPRSVSLSEFTPSFLELQFGRYRYGEAFADALWNTGQAELDEALKSPPSVSEHVLDPVAYLADRSPDPALPNPPADGTSFEEGVWGEASWAALLVDSFDRGVALEIADGWGGDRFVAWRSGTQACVRIHLAADSATELDDYAVALEAWAADGAGRDIFYPTADLIRITACG